VEAKKPAAATSVKNPDKTVTENTADRTEAVAVEEGSGETAAQSAQEVAPRPVAGPSPKPAAARRSAEQTHARPQVTEKTEPARAPQASVRETSAGRQLPQVVKVKGAESATDKKRPVAAQTTEPAPQAATPVALAVAVATPQPQPVATVAGTPAEAQKSDEQPKTAGAGRRQPAAGRQAHVASGQAPAAKGNAPANVALSHAPVARTAGKAAEEAATKEGSEAAVRTPIAPTPPTPPTAAAAVSAVAESATALPAAPVAPIVAAAAAAPVAQTAQAAFAAANHPPIVMGMRGQLLPDGGTMHIRLAPPELGELQVSVQVSAGAVAASFETSNDSATRLLSHTLGDLKTALETAGVTVARLQVSQAAPSTPRQGSDSASGRQKSSEDQAQPDGQTSARDQQRRELLRRMWRRVGGEPLDLVA
jgi:flagellar hook-length control protein FliK